MLGGRGAWLGLTAGLLLFGGMALVALLIAGAQPAGLYGLVLAVVAGLAARTLVRVRRLQRRLGAAPAAAG